MNVAVVIPYREDSPQRRANLETVVRLYEAILPGSPVVPSDSGHDPFNRAASRNAGVRSCGDADVVVVSDADVLPDSVAIHQAIDAASNGRLHFPFTNAVILGEHGNEQHAIDNSVGLVLVVTPGAWWEAGGQDERFTTWGFEDVAFAVACQTLLGGTTRHLGTVTHLWHPKDEGRGSPEFTAGEQLLARYFEAANAPDPRTAMKELIAA